MNYSGSDYKATLLDSVRLQELLQNLVGLGTYNRLPAGHKGWNKGPG